MQRKDHNPNGRNVNVTLDILRIYSASKEQRELLAACMLIKLWFSNGVLQKASAANFMKWFHVGRQRAARLWKNMHEDGCLFQWEGETIRTRSLRDKTRKYDKHGRRYSGAVCVVIKGNRNYTLKEICDLLRKRAITSCIKGASGKTTFTVQRINNKNDFVLPQATLTSKKLAGCIGMSMSSVSRITNKMAKEGEITKKPGSIFAICNRNRDEEIKIAIGRLGYKRPTFSVGCNTFIITPCSYSINSYEAMEATRHKIYGFKCKRRMRIPKMQHQYSTIPQLCGF